MEIERVEPDDWERVRAIRLRALVDAPDAFWETVEEARARQPTSWREQLAAPEAATFLACHDSVVEWARATGYRCLRLYVSDEKPPAVRLYARMGFEATGVTMNFPAPREHIQEHERILQL